MGVDDVGDDALVELGDVDRAALRCLALHRRGHLDEHNRGRRGTLTISGWSTSTRNTSSMSYWPRNPLDDDLEVKMETEESRRVSPHLYTLRLRRPSASVAELFLEVRRFTRR